MIRDTKSTSRFIVIMVSVLTLSHRTSGGGNWRRLERMFIQDYHTRGNWDENRIIFPDMTEDPTKSSWRHTTTPRYDDTVGPCLIDCPVSREFSPVCGTNGVTYQNMGQLQCAIKCGVDVDFQRPFACSRKALTTASLAPVTTRTTPMPSTITTSRNEEQEECIRTCPATSEYNPVCGTNRVTYSNVGKLQCANLCGVVAKLWRHSPCPTQPTSTSTVTPITNHGLDVVTEKCIADCPVTQEYDPVCGTDNVTYYNIGKLKCAKLCGVDINVQNQGRCSDLPNAQLDNDEDYGDEKIDARFQPRNQREYYWN